MEITDLDRLVVTYILGHYAMLSLWTVVIAAGIVTALRTGVYEIFVLSAGIIPLSIYYVYRILGVSLPGGHAVYHRAALVVFGISILLTLYLVHRRVHSE